MNIPLQTEITAPEFSDMISPSGSILTSGSCFSENIATRLSESGFAVCCNPSGILYNPSSILQLLNRLLENSEYTEKDLFFHNGLWHSFSHHGSFALPDKRDTLRSMNNSLQKAKNFLASKEPHLCITFGTACVWELISSGEVVTNCHKLPGGLFRRRILTLKEVTERWEEVLNSLFSAIPNLHIIFTVSPVRYLQENSRENSVSKSILHLAVNHFDSSFANVDVFPSFEIMNDELRDYRFYKEDMIHPSELACDIIFQRFLETAISNEGRELATRYSHIHKAMNHRILHPTPERVAPFCDSMLRKIGKLKISYPKRCFQQEVDFFEELRESCK